MNCSAFTSSEISSSENTGNEDGSFLATSRTSSLVPASFRPKQRQTEVKSLWQLNFYVLLYSSCAAFNSVLLGFDIGVMGGAVFIVKDLWALNDKQVGLVMGTLQISSVFGTFAAGYFSDTFGRTKSMCVAAVLFCVRLAFAHGSRQGLCLNGELHELRLHARSSTGCSIWQFFRTMKFCTRAALCRATCTFSPPVVGSKER